MLDKTKQQAVVEGVKEFFRVVVIAGVSAALTAAVSYAASLHDPLVQLALVTFLTSVGKAWDRKVHEDPTTSRQGVVPF
jgi:anti-sigma-K factor RskA